MKNLLFKKYTKTNLTRNEWVVQETTKHWINFFSWPIFLALLISPLVGIFYTFLILLGNAISIYIMINTDECVVTNKRVIFKSGLINTDTIEMKLSKIESLSVEQSILGSILDYGTVVIRGTGGTVETFECVNKPLEIKNKIQEYSY